MVHTEGQLARSADEGKNPKDAFLERWTPNPYGVQRHIDEVHLGRVGEGKFEDHAETEVDTAGIIVGFEQSAHGFTGHYVRAQDGRMVDALAFTEASKPVWQQVDFDRRAWTSQDSGKLGQTPAEQWNEPNATADEGVRSGIVRVIDIGGQPRYFRIDADFKGDADDWTVSGDVTEVAFDAPTDLEAIETVPAFGTVANFDDYAAAVSQQTVDRSNES